MKELVSILVTVYNGRQYIYKTLDSCLRQTYSNIEIIVLDDSSQISSKEIINDLICSHDNITYLENEQNSGFITTVNKAIELSNGKYVLALGQDDILPENHIEKMMECFSTDKIGLVFCDYILIDQDGKLLDNAPHYKKTDIHTFDLSLNNCFHSCGLIMNKAILNSVDNYTYFSRWPNYGEWLLWIKMSQVSKLVYCQTTKAEYRLHQTNMTKSFQVKSVKKELHKYHQLCRKYAYKSSHFAFNKKITFFINYYYCDLRFYFGYLKALFKHPG